METFTEAKPFVDDPYYEKKREEALIELEGLFKSRFIDTPIIEIIRGFTTLPHCFTLQSCFGHFVHDQQKNPKNVEPLSNYQDEISKVDYRIAYMVFCLQNNELGRKLFDDLEAIAEIDPTYIQFGSAEWFWQRCINSYVIQVEPERSKSKDRVYISMKEAFHIENVRNRFFVEIKKILQKHMQLVRK